MKFTWTPEYSVGVASIDEQHKHFFDIANEIVDLCETDASRDDLVLAITKLGDYAFYHLQTEEDYFNQFHYAEAQEHIAAHDRFREQVTLFLNSSRDEHTNIIDASYAVANFANTWLSNHILTIDQRYTESFHQHGLH